MAMIVKQVVGALVLSILALQAHGWWDTGHMLVAQIAYNHLSNGVASPQGLKALNNAISALVTYSNASDEFVTAACWMDDIKTRALVQFNNWHFINLPICDYADTPDYACNGTSVDSVLYEDDEGVNALWAIELGLDTIRSKTAKGFERGFALRNLIHIVGDLHQPLHAVARFAAETPYGDLGGNLFPITEVSFTKQLHGFWDSGLGLLNNNVVRPLNSSDRDYLTTTAASIMAYTANLTAAINTSDHQSLNATLWALESREMAILYTYNLTFNSTPSADYIATGWDIVQQRLGLGGYRLALLLKEIEYCFSDDSNCPDQSEPSSDKPSKTWFIVGIALAVALGISILINIILIARSSRAKYEPINDHHRGHHHH